MPLTPGTRLGRYEVRSKLGEGGMGEVYAARDPKLNRDVAIKVLPAAFSQDEERLRRFEQEAQAAGALNHPNVLAVYDVEVEGGTPYVVSELLEGETLREKLSGGALQQRRAVEYALQIARGLAAAHERGILHRDIKPENVFVTADGRVKILDFGLAKLVEPAGEVGTELPTRRVQTDTGQVMGTVGYMSPEQLRGQRVDARTDIFSFGALLYEMLSGRRAFKGDSAADVISAILREDPPDLTQTNQSVSPALERIVRHCLEKSPAQRFQSASDLAFDLESVSGASGSGVERAAAAEDSTTNVARSGARRWLAPALLLAALALAVAGSMVGYFVGRKSAATAPLSFRQLTFRRGMVWSARFAPDGQTVLYGAALEGNPIQVYSARSGSPESRPLGLPDGSLLAVSSAGELALSLNAANSVTYTTGTLARVPLTGGAPRSLLEDVAFADWSPDGKNLAVVHRAGDRWRLEYPVGKVLYETDGHISYPRFSPKGDLVAFMDHPLPFDDKGSVAVVDLEGRKRTLTEEFGSEAGLAWSPDGTEIWFTATPTTEDTSNALRAVTLAGRQRVLGSASGNPVLQDVSRDGRALLADYSYASSILGLAPGETKERELSWFDSSEVRDVTADGKAILFSETGHAVGQRYGVYLRPTDGGPAVRLGDGVAWSLSPDGKWALAGLQTDPSPIFLLPTGIGEPRQLTHDEIHHYGAWLLPDGRRVLFRGRESGHDFRAYLQDIEGDRPRPLTPDGTTACCPSPDGKLAVTRDPEGQRALLSLDGGETRPLPGVEKGETVIRWGSDGRSLYVFRAGELTAKVYRVDTATGRRELWKELAPPDPTGNGGIVNVVVTPDARAYFYFYYRDLSDLYLVEGLK